MKDRTSSLDLHFLVREFKDLEGCRLNKVFQRSQDFLFDFHEPGEGKRMLRVLIPDFVFFTKYKPDFPKRPPKFCMFLRKRLNGSFVRKVEQKDFDRILEITFETGRGDYKLILELFSKGNLILCKDDYEIVAPFQSQTWQARTIRGGTEYEYPPEQVNPKELSFDGFMDVVGESDMDALVKSMAVDMGLGGTYAEEICARAGVDKDVAPGDAGEDVLKKLYDALTEVLESEVKANSAGDEVFPIEMETKEEEEAFESFNEAIDEVISRNLVAGRAERKEDLKQDRIDDVKAIIRQQEESIEKLERDIEDNKKKGEMIFENYQEVSQLLYDLQQDRKELSWDEIKRKYEGHDLVEQINDKEKLVVVDL